MTSGLLRSARKKQELSLKFKKYSDNKKLTSYHKKYKNTFTKIQSLTKINVDKKKINNVSSNPKSTWKLIIEIINTSNDNDNSK